MPRLTAKESRQITRRERAEPVIENLTNIPNRDTLDARGRLSTGLDRRKLKFQVLTDEEQASNTTTGRVLASQAHENDPFSGSNNTKDASRAVSGDHVKVKALDGYHAKDNAWGARTIASVNASSISGTVPAGNLPAGVIIGNVGRGNIANNAVHAKTQVDWGVGDKEFIPIEKLASRPWPSVASVAEKKTGKQVVALIKKYVKPASLK